MVRRAFELAGARSVAMSMWTVPDVETGELMGRFYRGLMAGEGKAGALRAAMLEQIAKRRKQHGAAHPYFWGAFVLAGDPN
jgi:CHAT domain-containing protein